MIAVQVHNIVNKKYSQLKCAQSQLINQQPAVKQYAVYHMYNHNTCEYDSGWQHAIMLDMA